MFEKAALIIWQLMTVAIKEVFVELIPVLHAFARHLIPILCSVECCVHLWMVNGVAYSGGRVYDEAGWGGLNMGCGF